MLAVAVLLAGCGTPHFDAKSSGDAIRADAAHAMRICRAAVKEQRVDRDFKLGACAIAELEIHRQYQAKGLDVWEDER